jgi:hypothetical protein
MQDLEGCQETAERRSQSIFHNDYCIESKKIEIIIAHE